MIGSRYAQTFAAPPIVSTPPIFDPRDRDAISAQDPAVSAPIAAQVAGARQNSIWDRLGGVLKQPGMSGALLRGAAASFNGEGIGGAINAATGYMDHEKSSAARAEQQAVENALAERGANLADLRQQQANDLGWGGLTNQALGIEETGRHNRASEGLDANGQRIQLHGIETNAATARRGQDVQLTTNREDNATSRANNESSVAANIYGTNVGYLADGQRAKAAGIGSKAAENPYTETKTKTPARNPWFGTPTPASETTTHIPMAVSAPTSPPAPAAIAALKANPALAGQFEVKYGTGTAAQYLGGR